MFNLFKSLAPTLYIQLSPEKLTIRNVSTGETISEVPEMAISAKQEIIAVGDKARLAAASQGRKILNPFAHPRSLVSDFTVAQHLIKQLIRRMHGGLFAPSPFIVIHPLGSPAGGFTQVEHRAFHELALGAGARKVAVWVGEPLSDSEILAGKYKQQAANPIAYRP